MEKERNLGAQPIALILAEHNLRTHDLVSNSTEQISHKMVARAVKGRRLSPNVKMKILNALNKTLSQQYTLKQLFNY